MIANSEKGIVKKSLGFTMIELLVAATIIAVLSAIGMVAFRSANIRARDGKRKADIEQVRAALELYRSDVGSYPSHDTGGTTAANFNLMITDLQSPPAPYDANNYLTNAVEDPVNDVTYFYSYSSPGTSYQVCAVLEVDDSSYCLNSP